MIIRLTNALTFRLTSCKPCEANPSFNRVSGVLRLEQENKRVVTVALDMTVEDKQEITAEVVSNFLQVAYGARESIQRESEEIIDYLIASLPSIMRW